MNTNHFNKKNFSFFISVFVVSLISILLLNLPLVGTFGYEFSLIFAPVFFIIAGILNFYRIKYDLTKQNFLKLSGLILFIPVLIVIISGFFIEICSFFYGFFFYIIFPVISYLLGYIISEIIIHLFPRFRKTVFVLVIIFICIIAIGELYLNPQIYFYSPLVGYFPGTIYDEELEIDIHLIIYRGLNLLYFSSILILVKKQFFKRKSIIVLFTLITALAFILISPILGFSTTHSKLNSLLNNTIETEHFLIRFDKAETNEIINFVLIHEYYQNALTKELKPAEIPKITSYIFNNRNQKKKYFGSEKADVAKPWLNEIYISKESWNETLKHELAHIFSAEFGEGIFKVASSFNPALIEGFAEALENNFDNITLHTIASSAIKHGYKVDIEELFSGFSFFKSYSGLAYLFAGSFCKYLIDTYGIESFKKFYASNDAFSSFGKSISEIINEYNQYLSEEKILLSKNQIDYYFGRSSIFQKVCPRQIANSIRKANDLVKENRKEEAAKIFKAILERTSNYSALTGLINIYSEDKNYQQALNLIKNYIQSFEGTSYYFNLKLIEADLLTLTNEIKKSLEIYKFIESENPHVLLKSLSRLRLHLIENEIIKEYLNGSDSLKFNILNFMNKEQNYFYSIPTLINLAERLNLSTQEIMNIFNKPLIPIDYEDSYVLLILSKYLVNHSDYVNARKIAALAMRQSKNSIYYIAIREQFNKCDWILKNKERLLSNLGYEFFE